MNPSEFIEKKNSWLENKIYKDNFECSNDENNILV